MRWTGRSGFLTHLNRFPVGCLFVLVFLVPGYGLCQEKVQLFVDEVRFKGFPTSMKDQVPLWGSALAAEVSGILRDLETYTPMTLQTLESQLGKERRRAALECADVSCINRLVENFGISESVFGVVTWLGPKRVQVTLVHTAGDEKLGEAAPRYATPEYDAIAQALRTLAGELFGLRGRVTHVEEGRIGETVEEWNLAVSKRVVVRFESEPAGAVVLVDGELVCQSTPCSESLVPGPHSIDMQVKNYMKRSESLSVKHGTKILWELSPDFAWVTVTSEPFGLEVKIDDKSAGKTPLSRQEVSIGPHDVLVTSPCHYDVGERINVERGEERTVDVVVSPREGAIDVSALDPKGNALEADVYVDGQKIGRTPGLFKVPLCARELKVQSGVLGTYTAHLEVREKEVTTIVTNLMSQRLVFEDFSSRKVVLTQRPPLIVARVNGVDIDASEYFERLARIMKDSSSEPTRKMITKNVVDRLIDDALLDMEISRLGLEPDDMEIAETLGMDLERLYAVRSEMLDRIGSEIKKLQVVKLLRARNLLAEPTEQELRREHGARSMIRLNVVNFKVAAGAAPNTETKVKAQAEAFLAFVLRTQDFREAAVRHKDEQSRPLRVRPMIVRYGQEQHKDMWATASALDENQFGGPVRTRLGYSVFEVVKKITPKYSYDEMKGRLRKTVISQKSIEAKKALIEKLRADATIRYLVDF